LWVAAAAVPSRPGLRALLFLPGVFAPAVVALWLAARAEGREGTRALLERLFKWRVDVRWYVFAAGYMAAIKLAVAVVHRAAIDAWPQFGTEALYLIPFAIAVSTVVQAGEEIGWRGYALPRLAARLGLARASLVLGVVWAFWHLPLFYIAGTDTTGQSFPFYLLQVTALSVAIAWLYGHTGGSLPLVMLMHAAINNTAGIVPSAVPDATQPLALSASLVGWLTLALLWMGAGYFLLRMPKTDLSPSPAAAP